MPISAAATERMIKAGEPVKGSTPLEVAAVITAMIGTTRTTTAAIVMSPPNKRPTKTSDRSDGPTRSSPGPDGGAS